MANRYFSDMKNTCSRQDKKYLPAFGTRVRQLRKEAGFSQEDFALEVGLDRTYYGWSGARRAQPGPSEYPQNSGGASYPTWPIVGFSC
jgi:DNA-binding transcriptional regulator YiaG